MPDLMAQRGKRMDGRTNGRTEKQKDRQKISPFYKTLSPIGAAALLPPKKTKEGTAGQGSRWPFDAFGKLVFDEITSLCLKVRLPPHAFRKQLTSCCSTPSSKLANILNFSIAEKSKQMGIKKLPFLDNSWYSLRMPSRSSWQAVPAHCKIQKHTHPIF